MALWEQSGSSVELVGKEKMMMEMEGRRLKMKMKMELAVAVAVAYVMLEGRSLKVMEMVVAVVVAKSTSIFSRHIARMCEIVPCFIAGKLSLFLYFSF